MKKSIFYVCCASLLLAAAGCGDNRNNRTDYRADTTYNMNNSNVRPDDIYERDRPVAPDTGMYHSDTERTGNQIR